MFRKPTQRADITTQSETWESSEESNGVTQAGPINDDSERVGDRTPTSFCVPTPQPAYASDYEGDSMEWNCEASVVRNSMKL